MALRDDGVADEGFAQLTAVAREDGGVGEARGFARLTVDGREARRLWTRLGVRVVFPMCWSYGHCPACRFLPPATSGFWEYVQ